MKLRKEIKQENLNITDIHVCNILIMIVRHHLHFMPFIFLISGGCPIEMEDIVEKESEDSVPVSDLTTIADGSKTWKPSEEGATLTLKFKKPVRPSILQFTTQDQPTDQPTDLTRFQLVIKLIDDSGNFVVYPTSVGKGTTTTATSAVGEATTTTASSQTPVTTPGKGETVKVRPLTD